MADASVPVKFTGFAKLGFCAKGDGRRMVQTMSCCRAVGCDEWLERGWNGKHVVAQKADVVEGGLEMVQERLDKGSRQRWRRSC